MIGLVIGILLLIIAICLFACEDKHARPVAIILFLIGLAYAILGPLTNDFSKCMYCGESRVHKCKE